MLEKTRKFFKTKTYLQLFLIFLVFAVSGSLSVIVSEPVVQYIGLEIIDNVVLKTIVRIIIIFPLYQVILLIIGTIFGQFKYFWEFEKKFWKRFIVKKKND